MHEIHQDILKVSEGFILHQVNCRGVMGAGLARAIADNWPVVEERYHSLSKPNPKYPYLLLGRSQTVHVGGKLYVVNLFGQDGFGRSGVHTNYAALAKALATFRLGAEVTGILTAGPVYIPFKLGCGLGGGDWNRVKPIIEAIIPEAVICIP